MIKKFFSIIFLVSIFLISSIANAENPFSGALRVCGPYSKTGSVMYKNEKFDIQITLQKGKNGNCIYKEKVFQGSKYQLLTCTLQKYQMEYSADSMERFNQAFAKQIAKNQIFEAKMSTNGEIFNKYLADPKVCNITYSKK